MEYLPLPGKRFYAGNVSVRGKFVCFFSRKHAVCVHSAHRTVAYWGWSSCYANVETHASVRLFLGTPNLFVIGRTQAHVLGISGNKGRIKFSGGIKRPATTESRQPVLTTQSDES